MMAIDFLGQKHCPLTFLSMGQQVMKEISNYKVDHCPHWHHQLQVKDIAYIRTSGWNANTRGRFSVKLN